METLTTPKESPKESSTFGQTKNNVETVQQAFDNFLKGNIPAILDVCTDDVEWTSYENSNVPYGRAFHGKNGVTEFFKNLSEQVNYSRFEPQQYSSQGDDVVVLGHHTATVKSTGKTFDHDWCFSFKMHHGKLNRFFAYVDTRDHSRAFEYA